MSFDWKVPDYDAIFRARIERLRRIRANPATLPALRAYYRENPAQFVLDWGSTYDPRNVALGRPTLIPFVLFPKQVELLEWILARWRNAENGLIEKSRESGVTWCAVALACSLCLFNQGMAIGFGSNKLESVDMIGNEKSILEKARIFLANLPAEFLGGWRRDRHAPEKRIIFPGTGSAITGEGGDNIGRGGRTAIFFLDEAAHVEHPQLVDAALSANTPCRVDISTPCGRGNSFATRRHSGTVPVFTLHWRDDPRKDSAWYAKQCEKLDAVTIAQELDINYAASVSGIVIPAAWVNSAIDAHKKLGIEPSGARCAALDVADEGVDANAFAARYGVLLQHVEQWSGKGGDIFETVTRAFGLCDQFQCEALEYDADGLGAGVRGDARVVNEARRAAQKRVIFDSPFRGSGGVHDPEGQDVPGRKNRDYFANLKAQCWWALRLRFQATHRAVNGQRPFDPDSIISISSELAELSQLCIELSQPTYRINTAGKSLINKAPDGARSPNLADAVMIAYNPASRANWALMWKKLAS